MFNTSISGFAEKILVNGEITRKEALKLTAISGATHFSMMVSGFMPQSRDPDIICRTAESIRHMIRLKVCVFLGELTRSMAKRLGSAGISNYHHNLETAERHFYKR